MVDWNEVGKDEYLSAMIMSPVNDLPIKELLRPALTDKITDHETYLKGLMLVIIMKDIQSLRQRSYDKCIVTAPLFF